MGDMIMDYNIYDDNYDNDNTRYGYNNDKNKKIKEVSDAFCSH
jgi:hypothetical protein